MGELIVSKASDWKQGEVVQLPSGKVARLKKPDVINLILANGRIPDVFMPILFGKDARQGQSADIELTPELLQDMLPMMNTIIQVCFVEPRIVDNPDENTLGVNDVAWADKLWVFQWVFGGQGHAAATFPRQQAGNVATVSNGNGVRSKPPRATRPTPK